MIGWMRWGGIVRGWGCGFEVSRGGWLEVSVFERGGGLRVGLCGVWRRRRLSGGSRFLVTWCGDRSHSTDSKQWQWVVVGCVPVSTV